jgi:hypothetical protein
MRLSSIFSFDTLDVRGARRAAAWPIVLAAALALELGLRAGGARILPRPTKWGHPKVQDAVERYQSLATTKKPLDVLIFGTSQGYTWIDQKQLNKAGLSTVNASIPGGNMSVGRLLAKKVFFKQMVPRLVVVTVGPMSVAHWNEHLESIIELSPTGSAYLEDRKLALWLQSNVALLRFGGQRLDAAFISQLRSLWRDGTSQGRPRRAVLDADAVPTEGSKLRALTPSAEQFQALSDVLREAEAHGAKTAVINMPVCQGGKQQPAWPYAEYRKAMLSAVGSRPLLDLDAEASPSYFGDCVHPNTRGVEAFRERVFAFLSTRLAE